MEFIILNLDFSDTENIFDTMEKFDKLFFRSAGDDISVMGVAQDVIDFLLSAEGYCVDVTEVNNILHFSSTPYYYVVGGIVKKFNVFLAEVKS